MRQGLAYQPSIHECIDIQQGLECFGVFKMVLIVTCSWSSSNGSRKIKMDVKSPWTIVAVNHSSLRWLKRQTTPSNGEDTGKLGLSDTADEDIKWWHLSRRFSQFLKKLNMCIFSGLEILLLFIYQPCTKILLDAFFLAASHQKSTKFPSTENG